MARHASMSKAGYEHLAEFRWHLRQFLRFSEIAARKVGVSPQQHQALLAIKGFPGPEPILIGQLADRLQTVHHSAVGLVDRLVRQGFVRRVVDSVDRRRVHLTLTARGEQMLERLTATHRDQLNKIGPHLERLLKELAGR